MTKIFIKYTDLSPYGEMMVNVKILTNQGKFIYDMELSSYLSQYTFKKNANEVTKEEFIDFNWTQNWGLYCTVDEDNALEFAVEYYLETNEVVFYSEASNGGGYTTRFWIPANKYVRKNIRNVFTKMLNKCEPE